MMANTPEQFKKRFRDSLNKVSEDIDSFVAESARVLFDMFYTRSPVGEPSLWKGKPPKDYIPGNFKSNWNVSIGKLDNTVTNGKDFQAARTKQLNKLKRFKVGKSIFITNSVIYGYRLEYVGWSTQAPFGMVRLSVQEFDTKLKNIVSFL